METLSGRADASELVAAVDRSQLLTLRRLCLDVRRTGGTLAPDDAWTPFEELLRMLGLILGFLLPSAAIAEQFMLVCHYVCLGPRLGRQLIKIT